ncbi:MAG: hypothetical protein L6R41_008345 [Letrouitia leprolyta]|nr:MAG: hypothetical protein L6R41_008345 [Letrouitia leprolyta]
MASQSPFDTHLADQKVKTLVNAQLKVILKREKLAVSGLKAAMQNRIIGQLHSYARNRDTEKLNRLKGFINNPEALQPIAPPLPSNHTSYRDVSSAGQNLPLPPLMHPGTPTPVKPLFKESPFYTVLEPLTTVHECKVREATRDQVECKITLRSHVTDRLNNDPNARVMVFCASEPISHFSKVDIAFPHQVEIKVNMDEVKANLRGLKNRPGSTRPADITTLLRKRANYENSLSMTYALTHKKFYFLVNLVTQYSVEELVTRLKSGKSISKAQVIREMCNKLVSFEALEIDLYVDDILKTTPRSVDQVTVQPDGKWSQTVEGSPSSRQSHDTSEDDEELVEIKDPPRLSAVKHENNNAANFMRTPPASSREQSSSSVPPISSGIKRLASAVIDLTSDDDEGNSLRSSKRSTIPAYPSRPNHALLDKTHLSSRAGNPATFGSYVANPLSKPNYFQGGYSCPP